jgi:hypothetical protein
MNPSIPVSGGRERRWKGASPTDDRSSYALDAGPGTSSTGDGAARAARSEQITVRHANDLDAQLALKPADRWLQFAAVAPNEVDNVEVDNVGNLTSFSRRVSARTKDE